ncbi:MAG: TOBE domain-containing protein, partial [Rhodococcus sp. (in: high G+C Gram-positive bacteria)]
YVTHDQVEAMTMGDRVAVLKDGVLQQCDTPRRMYEHPDNVFVAGFIGSPAMNLLELPLVDGGVSFGGEIVPVPRASVAGIGESTVTLGVRPEDLEITTGSHSGLEVTIDVIEELGADAYVYGQADVNGKKQPIVVRADGRIPPRRGEVITLSYAAERTHLFSTVTGERLVD